jgi:hypothetical protein
MKILFTSLITIASLSLVGCSTLNENNRYGFIPSQEDSIGWEYQSRENILDSQDGSYRKNNGAIIWSSNPK